ncbi:MAG TPA: SRPBCC domain-containing protein [Candidatus Baltobacteraceae bacterium]|jgi:uncharacterized protein YndB with AHSA1/START domain
MMTAVNEIAMSREFDAPRELVYKMWTNPDHVAWWFGPKGFTMTIESMDVHPGGSWKFVMHGPDGSNYDNHIVYSVVEPPSRLCYSHMAPKFDVEIMFEDVNGKTRLTSRMIFDTVETRNRIAEEHGAIRGLEETLARLAEFAGYTAAAAAASGPHMVATRVFDAPRELVFKANTDPEMMMRWWGPHHTKNLSVDIDLRVGGEWHVKQEAFGEIHDFGGKYLEIDPPSRLVMTFVWGGAPEDTVTSYNSYEDAGGKTRLTSRIVFSSLAMRDRMISQGMCGGMMQSNERLDMLLEKVQ